MNTSLGPWERVYNRLSRGFTQGAFARDVDGNMCNPKDINAVSWCILGAMMAENVWEPSLMTILKQAIPVIRNEADAAPWLGERVSAIAWNDWSGRTQSEVLALIASLPLPEDFNETLE